MDEEMKESVEAISSELAYLGKQLTQITKCLKKMSNWTEADESKYADKDEDEGDEEEK